MPTARTLLPEGTRKPQSYPCPPYSRWMQTVQSHCHISQTSTDHRQLTYRHQALLRPRRPLICCPTYRWLFALMRLGELTFPDNKTIQNPAKISKRTSVVSKTNSFQFFLLGHKADRFFEGNNIVLMNSTDNIDIFHQFAKYLNSRDRLHPFSSPLWLR